MRRKIAALVGLFAFAVGIGAGLAPSPVQAYDCYVKCKNGIEYVCCPRHWQYCVNTGQPCSF